MVTKTYACPHRQHVIKKPSQAQNNVYFPLYLCPEVTCLPMSMSKYCKRYRPRLQDWQRGRQG